MAAPVLVTGANGFIASYVVRRLLDRGDAVRVLVRRPAALPAPVRAAVTVVAGDLRSEATLRLATESCGAVLHLAACAKAWSADPAEFHDVNTVATTRLLAAARDAGVSRFVHGSTILATPPHRSADVPLDAARLTPYEVTKIAAESEVQEAVHRGLPAVIVRPTRVYGPGHLGDANAVTRIVHLYLQGRFRVRIADGGVLANYVHADDVAAGILLAAERGTPGAAYYLGGTENVAFVELLEHVARIGGVRRRVVAVPPAAALALGRAAEWWGALGGTAPVTAGWVRTFLEDRRVDITPTRTALGYAPRSLHDGLVETIAWLRAAATRRAA
jgi:nucleoside-diphosphate-sugar epimerase